VQHVYRINLNKGEDKAARIAQQLESQRWLLLILLVLLAGGVGWYTWTSNRDLDRMIADKQQKIDQVKAELQQLKETGNKLSKRDIFKLAKLEKSRLLWTQKIMGLGMETTRDMALTSVRFEKGYLYITGIHKVREGQDPIDNVMAFVDQLKANKLFNQDFESIQFANSQDIVSHDQKALLFEIQCKIMPRFLSKDFTFGQES
jgi:cell division protein FtsB